VQAVVGRDEEEPVEVGPNFHFLRGKGERASEDDLAGEKIIGVCISRVSQHMKRSGDPGKKRGYIGMLAI